jgi:tetratricopeptide (TPR) repeat protein
VVGMVLIAGGGWSWMARQRAQRRAATAAAVNDAMADAILHQGQARAAAVGDPTRWTEALAAAQEAQRLMASGEADSALRARVLVLKATLEREQAQAQAEAAQLAKDRTLIERLEVIQGSRADHWNRVRTDTEYAAAFRDYGLDLDRMDPQEAGIRIAQRPAAAGIAAALDNWAMVRRSRSVPGSEASCQRLVTAARAADPDPWRNALRDQIGRNDLAALQRLAGDKELAAQPATSLDLLAGALEKIRDFEHAAAVLRTGWQEHPGDFWLNQRLGYLMDKDHLKHPDEMIRYWTATVAIHPHSFVAHSNLGIALFDHGKLHEAITEYHTAIRLKPDYAGAHNNLGNALLAQGNRDEAIAEWRTAIRVDPDYSASYDNLGAELYREGQHDEALAALRNAVRLNPARVEGRFNLSQVLVYEGQFQEAVVQLKTLLKGLGPTHPSRSFFQDWLERAERKARLSERLPAFLSGEATPADNAERLALAEVTAVRKRYATSAGFYAAALAADPKLVDDWRTRHQYDAACAAARAGTGQGRDEPPPDDAGKTRLRQQALDWLKAELAHWSKQLESGPPRERPAIVQSLKHWQQEADLASVRDADSLARLPGPERNDWQALWIKFEELLRRAVAGGAPKPASPAGELPADPFAH